MRLFSLGFRSWLLVAILCAAAVPAFAQNSTAMPSCSSGDPVVWVNTSSKVYHLKGDRYFGNTKSGNYECKSAADKAGYRQAQVSPIGKKSPSAAPSPHASHTPRHHKPKASPSPGPAAT